MADTGSQSPVALNSAALKALREGDALAAKALFEAALALDPQAVPLWMNLATAARAACDVATEQKALDAALDLDRLNFMPWLRKAQLLERRGDQRAALDAWRAALQLFANIGSMAPDIARDVAHGQAFVETVGQKLVASVDQAFSDVMGTMEAPDKRRVSAFLDHILGRRKIYQNQCAGLYYPFLPADEYFDDHFFPWFDELNAQTDAIRAEFEALYSDPGDSLRPYVQLDKGGPEAQWAKLNNSLDWGALFLWEFGRPNQAVLDRCPVTARTIESIPSAIIPGRAPNIMFSVLKPGAHIPPHTGVTNTRAVVHLPLIVPEKCGFRVGGETREWQVGRAFAFDDTIEHEAWNHSSEFRAILMLDVWNPYLTKVEQEAIIRYFAAAEAAGMTGN